VDYERLLLEGFPETNAIDAIVAGHLKVIHPWTPESDSQVDRRES